MPENPAPLFPDFVQVVAISPGIAARRRFLFDFPPRAFGVCMRAGRRTLFQHKNFLGKRPGRRQKE
ncbi:hypothetical protein [Desulfovibrio sp.]|uniref:hypothetical protein n=1 Tax=Desulfovibrio sp. TaxID=885 RepID=UPI0025BFE98C|nr:hypothetical protein [Desulfovibrio sp.]